MKNLSFILLTCVGVGVWWGAQAAMPNTVEDLLRSPFCQSYGCVQIPELTSTISDDRVQHTFQIGNVEDGLQVILLLTEQNRFDYVALDAQLGKYSLAEFNAQHADLAQALMQWALGVKPEYDLLQKCSRPEQNINSDQDIFVHKQHLVLNCGISNQELVYGVGIR